MPVYRGPDGKIIEERSHSPQQGSGGKNPIEEATRKVSSRPAPPDKPEAASSPGIDLDDEVTRAIGRRAGAASDAAAPAAGEPDPVAGWLVIMDGPGRGQSFNLHYGQNAIGRGSGQAITLDFGDIQISRDAHATVTYDPKGRKFYVQGGQGRSLTYLDGDVVLAPQALADGQDIQLGETVLKFVAFCGPEFDWLED